MRDIEQAIVAISLMEDRLDYYSSLLGFLDDNLPNLEVLIEQFEEQYYKEGENE